MNHSLSEKGLSLSQAQNISNLCFQSATEIENKLNSINNTEKTVKINGDVHIVSRGVQMPEDIEKIVLRKASYHACQAFLMFNIKEKESLIEKVKKSVFETDLEEPEYPKLKEFVPAAIPTEEDIKKEFISTNQMNEFLVAEAYAAHIGKFIHKNGKLDLLRKELLTIQELDWLEVKSGEKTPVKVKIHHDQEQLLKLHNSLAIQHRDYEKKVNYLKAMIKNILSVNSAKIISDNVVKQKEVDEFNSSLIQEYSEKYRVFQDKKRIEFMEFEKKKVDEIKRISALRINVPEIFQDVINEFGKDDEGR